MVLSGRISSLLVHESWAEFCSWKDSFPYSSLIFLRTLHALITYRLPVISLFLKIFVNVPIWALSILGVHLSICPRYSPGLEKKLESMDFEQLHLKIPGNILCYQLFFSLFRIQNSLSN